MTVQRRDAIEVLMGDHQAVEQLFRGYEAASGPDERTRIAHQVVHDLAVHGEIEELLFYPKLRGLLPDGDELADHSIEEHLDMKQTLNELDSTTAEDPEFDRRMRRLMDEMRHHVEEEETELFPRVREAMPHDDLVDLGEALEGARMMVPTRPHPSAPTGAIAKMVTGPPVALIDRVRDALRKAGGG